MIISIWRYSHLALALSSAVFVLMLTLTGIVLAFDPVSDRLAPNERVSDHPDVTLADVIETVQSRYLEVLSISTDANGFISVSVITEEGDLRDFYIHPVTGEKTGELLEQSEFTKFATNLHRSLFLKGPGRFFIGLSSFLLFLIAASGLILIAKRQQGIRNLFKRIVREGFIQYSHIYLGRVALIPLIVITLTGVYLSLLRFSIIPDHMLEHEVDYEAISSEPEIALKDFNWFKNTSLSEVRSLDFPFSPDPMDYYQLSLRDKEVLINQYTGEVLSEIPYPIVKSLTYWSTILHTGKGNITWSLILAFSCLAILYFMYSGFSMTLTRRAARIKNSFRKNECTHIILVGSETGSTLGFAKLLHNQLMEAGIKSFIAELNTFTHYPKMDHMIVFTATYGQGEAPTNATKFESLIQSAQIARPFQFSVVGFGSLAYPDFCKFALDVDRWLQALNTGTRLMQPFTINKRSLESFAQWAERWGNITDTEINISKAHTLPKGKKKTTPFEVVAKASHEDTFLLTLEPQKKRAFVPGDLLAVFPDDGSHERLYSMGMNAEGQALLSIKRHEHGVCSSYLDRLAMQDRLDAQILGNKHFHFPGRAKRVIMISSGTGIAPFIGMLHRNKRKAETYLYWGGRTKDAFELYEQEIQTQLSNGQLLRFEAAYSRQGSNKTYVQHLIERDKELVAEVLSEGGTLMICGSVAMQNGVTQALYKICTELNHHPLSHYQNAGQILMDCY